ncbi:helix-turn-helix domain containing protein [Pseudoalteromonas sp. Isolate6]|uniref:helix-turn-helix domain-containing protein n=1 Tax=Pseudoalteromonas sp. Isolate6 TaxID=2908527 RepID=UPI001EFDF035|nr:helix-turn-helix domain-containing protein [Pseudoalteromonas sp. Isolate6]MCG9758772.1 helix-turn-helix domain containing protein [Pseudoalteromonas sp. Isolate6]
MNVSSTHVFERIKHLYDFKNLTELSKYFGKNGNWAASMNKNDSIPYPQCVQAAAEKGVSLDWLLFGKDSYTLSKSAVLSEIQDGIYESVELGILDEISTEQLKATSALILKKLENITQISAEQIKNEKAVS